jgi:hypothetical protein
MATAASIADIARRLESEVERHGCGMSCDLCQDVEDALLSPAPGPPTLRPASAKRTGEHLAIPEGLARQEAQFDALAVY